MTLGDDRIYLLTANVTEMGQVGAFSGETA
jgi:hypothetical protein